MSTASAAARLKPRHVTINGHRSIVIGPEGSSHGREIYLATPGTRDDHEDRRWLFGFGGFSQHGCEYVLVRERTFQDALDEAAEYVLDRWPGFSAAESIADSYREIVRERGIDESTLDEDEKWSLYEEAEVDTMPVGGYGDRMHSEDVHLIAENPTREELVDLAYPGGPDSWRADDGIAARHPIYRPTRRDFDPDYHARAARAEWGEHRAMIRSAAILALGMTRISRAGFDRIDAALHGERFKIGDATF